MTNLLCASPIQGLVIRVVSLNACGVPVTGSSSAQVVWDGFTQVQTSPQYDNGNRVITRKADGTLCVNFKFPDQYTNDEVTIDLCGWNVGLPVGIINARLLTATASPTGTGFAHGTWSNATPKHFSLELWQVPASSCDGTGTAYYPYHAWPHLSDGKRGDTTFGPDASMLQLKANSYDASPLWTVGNSYLGSGQVVAGDHYLYNLQSTTPPPSACAINAYP